jgi:hypothetical protein
MKKLLITSIIIINAVTLYFWVFPYQSEADMNTFRLAEHALKRQTSIIHTAAENNIRTIRKEAEAYPVTKGIKDTATAIYSIYKDAYNDVQVLRDKVWGALPQDYAKQFHESDETAFSFWNRIRPFHYRVPKQVFNENLTAFCTQIQAKQDSVLSYVDDADFKKTLKDSLFIDVENLPKLLKNVSSLEASALLSSIQNRLCIARTRTTEHLANKAQMMTKKYEFREFVPIVYANTSHLKLGDTYEAEVFAAAYYRGSDMKATVNGKKIPVKDGVAIYTVTPTSVGKKKASVKMYITNPLTKKTSGYYREFEYEVVDCN